ncbi:MAG: SRPBCC family protein [Candidatus Limnocylindrales bacterium]
MSRVEQTIDVDVPVRVAYDQWTQFEEFPEFMEAVQRVTQQDDQMLEWEAKVAGQTRTWTAKIVDQTPDTRIAWKSVEGTENAGAVVFESLGSDKTRLKVTIDADPQGVIENIGDAIGLLDHQVKGDLDRFKTFIESRHDATGAWRGEIHGDAVTRDARAETTGNPSEAASGESQGDAVRAASDDVQPDSGDSIHQVDDRPGI